MTSSNDQSVVVATGANSFTKTFTVGEQGYSRSASIEITSDGSLLVGSTAEDADENTIYTITKLDGVTGEIKLSVENLRLVKV